MARVDPFVAFKFHIEIEGIIEAGFLECSGLDVKRKVETYKEGGINNFVHQLPGQIEYSKITLKKGLAVSSKLWDWCQEGLHDGKVKRRNVSIILFDRGGQEAKRWNLEGAYPTAWTGPQLKADTSSFALETLELVHHGLTMGRQ